MAERSDDEDRKAILARRNRFIAIALSGLASAGCYQAHGPRRDAEDAAAPADASPPAPCLGASIEDAGPRPCLEPPIDAGPAPCLDAPLDAGPAPCLGAPLDAGSAEDAAPTPCLSRPAD